LRDAEPTSWRHRNAAYVGFTTAPHFLPPGAQLLGPGGFERAAAPGPFVIPDVGVELFNEPHPGVRLVRKARR
jgi:hypothetical protein